MSYSRRMIVALLACGLTGLTFGAALAGGTTVQVSLWDKGGSSMNMMGDLLPLGMGMMGSDMSMVTMGITANMTEVPAGDLSGRQRFKGHDPRNGHCTCRRCDNAHAL